MQIKHVISAIETFAPPALQEKWDNTGLQVGDARAECTGVLIALDVTPGILSEAKKRGCNLVVSHHPLLFRGLKRITGRTPAEQCVVMAIIEGISVYSCHTALDSTFGGVSYAIAKAIGAKAVRTLHPAEESLLRVTVYTPREKAEEALAALADADFGRALSLDATETVSTTGNDENGLPVLDMSHRALSAVEATIAARRRSEVASMLDGMTGVSYTFSPCSDTDTKTGLGVVAMLEQPMPVQEFVALVKEKLGVALLRCNEMPEQPIQRIAICGGAGGEFIGEAVSSGAQAYLTADVRYHDFGEWAGRIFIVDAGHYETENCTKMLLMHLIKEKFANFAVYISETEKNPINYL